VEETLDVSMVSAACPHCKILLVEATSATFADLAAAENAAARLGAAVISNSYGARENGIIQAFAKAYNHPGHTIVASSGDAGFTAADYPANLASVTAVGGTELARAHNRRGWAEKVWNTAPGASGSGCSAYAAKPAWQHDPHCPGRTVADVAALAWDVTLYDSSLPGLGPWLLIGGTSASAPLIAGVYALAGNATTVKPGFEYTHPGALFDITTGNNDWIEQAHGAACGFDYLCVAKHGYNAPTGLGTPTSRGTKAHRPRHRQARGKAGSGCVARKRPAASLLMSEFSASHCTARRRARVSRKGVPHWQQARILLVEFAFDAAEGTPAPDRPGQPAPGTFTGDPVGETGHVLVPDPTRQRADDSQVQLAEVDGSPVIEAGAGRPECHLARARADRPVVLAVALAGQRGGNLFQIGPV
jgi:hypothetical protein